MGERWGDVGLQLQVLSQGSCESSVTGFRSEERGQRNMRMRLEDYIKNVQHEACVDLQWVKCTVLSLLLLRFYRLHSCLKRVEEAMAK